MAIKGDKKIAIDVFRDGTAAYLLECKTKKNVPFLSGLAEYLDIDYSTLNRYVQNASYARYIKKVQLASENGLINKGLNENKPVFPIFLLKAKFGYIEQQKMDITSNGETLGIVALPERKAK